MLLSLYFNYLQTWLVPLIMLKTPLGISLLTFQVHSSIIFGLLKMELSEELIPISSPV